MEVDKHVFQGMQQDSSEIYQDSNMLRDALNIRITDRDNPTQFSITVDKGNVLGSDMTLQGKYIGHCLLDKQNVLVFTQDETHTYFYKVGGTYNYIVAQTNEPILDSTDGIKTLHIYENDNVDKVYWVQPDRQPRVINIAYFENTGVQEVKNPNMFDFVPELQLNEQLQIDKIYGGGIFSPGVIQYGITYYNLYGQESNLAIVSPLYYISDIDKAGDPSKSYSNSFKITVNGIDTNVNGIDTNFEYMRIYSIHRTSLDQVPTVHIVKDIKIVEYNADQDKDVTVNNVTIIDNGTYKETIDPTLLLYIGGREIYARCITQKDNTLFLGNISLPSSDYDFISLLSGNITYSKSVESKQSIPKKINQNQYYYKIQNLDGPYSGIFKCNQKYRIGIQGQYKNGTWTPPVHLFDAVVSENYPKIIINYTEGTYTVNTDNSDFHVNLPCKLKELLDIGIKKLRTVIVYPKFTDKRAIAQGVLCPTVFNYYSRMTNAPFAQSSWFFRPVYDTKNAGSALYGEKRGEYVKFNNLDVLDKKEIGNINAINQMPKAADDKYNSQFFIDENVVTFHSPDLDYNEDLWSIDYTGYELQIIGAVPLNSIYGNVNIETKSPPKSSSGGSIFKPVGYVNNQFNVFDINGGAVGGSWWQDDAVKEKDDKIITSKGMVNWLVSTWQRTGSLNNDFNHEKGDAQSSILQKKQISNIKVFNSAEISPNILTYDPQDIQLVMNYGEQTVNYLDLPYLQQSIQYQGNIDTLLPTSEEYYIGQTNDADVSGPFYSKSPVRMKYLSSPHLAISLPSTFEEIEDESGKTSTTSTATLLPRVKFYEDFSGDKDYELPDWYYKYSGNKIDPKEDYPGDSGFNIMDIYYIGYYYDDAKMTGFNQNDKWVISQKPNLEATKYDTWAVCKISGNKPLENNNINTKVGYIPDTVNNAYPILHIRPDCVFGIPKNALGQSPLNNDDEIKEAIVQLFVNANYDYFGLGIKLQITKETLGGIDKSTDEKFFYVTFSGTQEQQNIYGYVSKLKTTFPFKPGEGEEEQPWANSNVVGCRFSEAAFNDDGTINTPTQDNIQRANSFKFKRDLLWKDITDIQQLPEVFRRQEDNTHFRKRSPYVLLAEIVRKGADDENSEYNKNLFGGTSEQAINNNMWFPASEAFKIEDNTDDYVILKLDYGDCFFGRYDCLKTYAANLDDENQVVEIGSFPCESWINFDGRYDNRIGILTNWTTNNTNFNKINPVYSQKDNFFNYNILPDDFYNTNYFRNQITWGLTKTAGATTDVWTNITLANTIDVNGSNGAITDLFSLGDNIYCLQDNSINQILYNDRVQIQPSDEVPIEIANSGKVSGVRVISDSVGMQNPFGICKGEDNIYFVDGINSGLYQFNGQQVQNISTPNKMFQWHKEHDLSSRWYPSYRINYPAIRLCYDKKYKDIYYLSQGKDNSLNYSALLGTYVSNFSLQKILGMERVNDDTKSYLLGFQTTDSYTTEVLQLFNADAVIKNAYITFISTDKTDAVKIFDTMDVDGGVYKDNKEFYEGKNICPVEDVTVTNDYQSATGSNFKKKFRLWRTQFPRDKRQRIRNPWTQIKLILNNSTIAQPKINSITVHYTK